MRWKIIDTPAATAQENMERDRQLLEQLQPSEPILHFYDWKGDAATYGYFIKPKQHINFAAAAKHQLQLARRPTGGGIIFHLFDLAFSILIPADHPNFTINTLENYRMINTQIAQAIRQFLGGTVDPLLLTEDCQAETVDAFCMAKPILYDLIVNGKKIGGGAQRRTKKGFLHQGSLALSMPSIAYLNQILLEGSCVLSAMQRHSYLLLGEQCTERQLREAREELKKCIRWTLCI